MANFHKHKYNYCMFISFVFVFMVVYIVGSMFSWSKSYNFFVKVTSQNRPSSSDIKLIVIDDKSLHDIDRWPWRRNYYLEIFDYFETYTNAKLVGYDGLIVSKDANNPKSDEEFFCNVAKFKKLTAGFAFSADNFEAGIDVEKFDKLLNSKFNIQILDKRTKKDLSSPFKSFSALQEVYFENINSLGHVNMLTDSDGYLRRTAQLISYKGKFYPSLALVMYSKLTGIHRFVLTDENLWGISDDYTLKIPINFAFGSVVNLLHFYKTKDGVYSHEHYSAGDIIKSYRAIKNGEKPIISPEIFNNKIVFVGANAQAQALQDIQRTPVSEVYSGADIQAINFDNLINNDFYFRTNKLYNFILCVLIFFVVFVFVLKLSIPYALISGFSVGFIYFAFALLMYQNKVAIDVILPEVFVIVALVCAYSYKYFVEDLKKTKIQNAMGKYLSYDVMQKVVTNIDNVSLGGKREDITVLFADIRNFTSISETMDPNSTSMILNEYFTEMVPIIEGHRGILNKFMGDAILAIFGEPKKSDNHAYDAVLCASKMLSRVSYLQSKWLEEGKPKIEIGIGICSGEAFIGNIGSNERLEYTVIGDTVNTASRIENYNKVYRTNFLISESTYERVKDFVDAIVIRDVVIRGKAGRINLYEVIRLKNEREF